MRFFVLAAALLVALFARPAASADSFLVVDAFEKDGAQSLIIVPHSWNGAFIVYAHGYDSDYRDIKPYPSDITPGNITSKLSGADLSKTKKRLCRRAPRQRRRRAAAMARSTSRFSMRSRIASRLSCSFLPRPRPSSALARPFTQ